jgi:uncharacterized membrane protein
MRTLLNPLRVTLLAGLVLSAVAGFVLVPAGKILPVHWGISGAADAFAPRELALLLPLVMAGLGWALFLLLPRLAKAADLDAGKRPLGVTLTAITALALLLEVAMVLLGLDVEVNMVQVISIALGGLLIVLGDAMPKSRRNSLAGIRIPTTLHDPANWQATHRLTGFLTMMGGVVLIIAALVAHAGALVWWLLACVFVPIAVGVLFSLAYARQAAERPKAGRRH